MTNTRSLRPDARLVHLHAERSDPQVRLAEALAHLEEADWGYLFAGEAALARQLVAMLGPGALRVDGRIPIDRSAFAEAGLAVADLHGDLHGARAAWLFEPDQRTLERVCRANVPIIVDGTLAPGGGWPDQGANFVLYRNAVTLSGHTDVELSALFGMGQQPVAIAPAPSDLSVAVTLRDVATLPLRLARTARIVTQLAERFAGKARTAGPTALLLPPDSLADTLTPLGGVLAALKHVPEGLLLTPGLEDVDAVMQMLQNDEIERATAKLQKGSSDLRSETVADSKDHQEVKETRDKTERRARSTSLRFSVSAQAASETAPSRPNQANQSEKSRSKSAKAPKSMRKTKRMSGQQKKKEMKKEVGSSIQSIQQPQADSLERFTFEAPVVAEPENHTPVADITVPNVSEFPPLSDLIVDSQSQESAVSESEDQPKQIQAALKTDTPETKKAEVKQENSVLQADSSKKTITTKAQEIKENQTASTDNIQTKKSQASQSEVTESEEVASKEAKPKNSGSAKQLKPDLPGGKEDPAADLSEDQSAIFSRLREWRNAEAKRQEISRFIIASNATLAEIARRIPYTREDLGEVRGMGPGRMAKYGEKILELVRG